MQKELNHTEQSDEMKVPGQSRRKEEILSPVSVRKEILLLHCGHLNQCEQFLELGRALVMEETCRKITSTQNRVVAKVLKM